MNVLKVEFKNFICQATINRPKTHNAINFEVMDALDELLNELETNNSRCFVLTGAGKSFISGGDLKKFHTIKTAEKARLMARRMLSILKRIEKLPCWTIAAINGPAYGGGCEIMLAFDFRIASTDATFGFTQGKFYLPPGWGGLTRLVERVGRSTALRWLAEAQNIDAKTALKHKLIDEIAEDENLMETTRKWASLISKNDRDFIHNLKQGALRIAETRWEAIANELDSFTEFWENDLHGKRVEKFLNHNNADD